jgi:pimeloyl-ACP methyl ester carboxylesterase
MPVFKHDGLTFNYVDDGTGLPFVFQHGLGGDVNQPAEYYTSQPGVRCLTLDCRGHGETRPLGPASKLNFEAFADDVLALLDRLGIERCVAGGISMGAGVALNLAVRYPDRVRGLVLARPAWLDAPLPGNMRVLAEIGELIQRYGAAEGLARFEKSRQYADIAARAPDVAQSLLGQFTGPRAEETAAKLICLAQDAPVHDRAAWSAIRVPTLVLATGVDPVHPLEYGRILAAAIPGATFQQLTPKSVDRPGHAAEMGAAIRGFLAGLMAGAAQA